MKKDLRNVLITFSIIATTTGLASGVYTRQTARAEAEYADVIAAQQLENEVRIVPDTNVPIEVVTESATQKTAPVETPPPTQQTSVNAQAVADALAKQQATDAAARQAAADRLAAQQAADKLAAQQAAARQQQILMMSRRSRAS